ncbi:VOC family protein [Streptomyces sp. WAC06614]|uniref:VOC family protein n=1 Tax=Streptomyces sp. WAC06614 TaxID=2487416 RepID=UPI000F7AF45A|nr:VOC family protein [Streptomyces sp. WAC06614]RSS50743.1 VOC family protein [Streptomyces sp. WAC06614]
MREGGGVQARISTGDVFGAPCWVSLMSRDHEASQRFYGAVLGWDFRPGEAGEAFSVAEVDGVPVAGIGAVSAEMTAAVAWTPYFAVDDADRAVDRIRERTGTVAVGPVSLGEQGRAALAADPDGAVFGIWEGHVRQWRIGEAAAPAWLELRTRNAFDAAMFYGEVLEWATGRPGCCEVSYEQDKVVLRQGGEPVARLASQNVEPAAFDPQVRPRWHVHFRVPALEPAVAAALALGGHRASAVHTSDQERCVTLRDPDGALFDVTEDRGGTAD